jgi:hypothetical protein
MIIKSSNKQLNNLKSNYADNKPILRSLSTLCVNLHKCFEKSDFSQNIINNVAKELQKYGKKGVTTLINEILSNQEMLSIFADNIYLHKNGFYKLNLITLDNFTVRLHIWLPHTDSMETLHDHRWYIASAIIDGSLKSEIWEDSASPHAKSYDEYMYIDKYTDPILLGQTKVEFVKQIVHKAGDCYVLNTGVLHRIISHGESLTATLICHSGNAKRCARNIIINEQVPDVKPNYLKPDELAQLLNNYLMLSAK